MLEYFERLNQLISGNIPFVAVTIVDTVGSVPQHAGSKMLVTADGLFYGTVGGGKVESRAIEEAREFLVEIETRGASAEPRTGSARTRFIEWNLSKDIGMTCGGSVKLYFESFNVGTWNIVIFGAGHCSNALIKILINLDCRITCYDPREEWLSALPDSPRLKKVLAGDMPSHVSELSADAFVVLITMGHTTDSPILVEVLKHWQKRPLPYLGVIGSRAKAARLKKDIDEAGLDPALKDVFHCPVGLPLGSNHPHEIAISIAAQLIQVRDRDERPRRR
ncbi:MAG: XdhC family protein [Candidatus Obscuribacterales bacterium]